MRRLSSFFVFLKVPVDILLLLFAASSAYALRFADIFVQMKAPAFALTFTGFMELAVWLLPLWLAIFAIAGLYTTDPNQKLGKIIVRSIVANAAAIGVIAMALLFSQQQFDSRFLVAAGWGFATLYIIIGRLLIRGFQGLLYRSGVGKTRLAIIGDKATREPILKELTARSALGFDICVVGTSFSKTVQKEIIEHGCDEILLLNPQDNKKAALEIISFANQHHITVKYTADLFSTYAINAQVSPLAGLPIIELKRSRLEGWGFVIKRIFDIFASLFFIILFSPVMLLTAIAIKLDSKGPVLFSYNRVGRKGELFRYTKFRSMVKDAHKLRYDPTFRKQVKDTRGFTKDNPMVKYENDPRITRVGKLIRRFSIDELPEFFMVLKGDMSLVGPRPHEPEEVEKYKPEYKRVLWLKPGITGLSQVSGRSDLNFEEEVQLDVLYMERWSVFLDIIIIIKTPFILMKRRKAL